MTSNCLSALLLALTLAACSRSSQPAPAESGKPVDAVRIALPEPAPAPAPRPSDAKPAWSSAAGTTAFGYPGEPPLLTLACQNGRLVITRNEPAEQGAQALFALIGNGKILRLPVDAARVPGSRYPVWQGSLGPGDAGGAVFLGEAVDATLPGAGKIVLAGGPELRSAVTGCIGQPAASAAVPPAAAE